MASKAKPKTGTRGTPKKEREAAEAAERERIEQEAAPTFEHEWMAPFIDHVAEGGHVKGACAAAGVGRSTVYRYRQSDEVFAVAWSDAELAGTEALEEEAKKRAVDGVDKPVFFEGREIGAVREYSDTLLIFLLKGRKPETYRDRIDHRHSGRIGPPSKVDLSKLSTKDLAEYERITAQLESNEQEV